MDFFKRHSMSSGESAPIWYPAGMDPCILGYTNGTFPNGTHGQGEWTQFGIYSPSSSESTECQKNNDPWLESPKYAHYTSYFLVVCLLVVAAIGLLKRMDSLARSSGFLSPFHVGNKIVALFRALSYPKLSWKFISIPPVGPLSLLVVFFSFSMAYTWGVRPYYRPPNFGSSPLGLRSEWIATAMMPWLYALAMKRNLFRFLTGASLESTQIIHRWSPWICLYFSLVHTVAMCIRALDQEPWSYTWRTNEYYWNGTAALVPLAWLCFTGIPIVRHYMYRFWLVTHLLAAVLFLVFMYIHCAKQFDSWTYLHFTVVIWGMSIIAQHGISVYQSMQTKASIEHVTSNILRIRIPIGSEKGCAKIYKWCPGQHAQLRFWSLGPFAANPFSICSLPSDKELVFIVRTERGLTQKLFKLAKDNSAITVPVIVDGPYGGVGDVGDGVRSADSALLIAGGVGITYIISVFKDLVKCACDTKDCKDRGESFSKLYCQNVRLVWSVKNIETFEAFAGELRQVVEMLPAFVSIDLFVTGTKGEKSDIESSASTSSAAPGKQLTDSMPIQLNRPSIPDILEQELNSRQGKLIVAACGPTSLTHDTRSSVAKAQWSVFRNETQVSEVELWDEVFCY